MLALPIASFAAFMVFSSVTSWMGYDIWNDASPPLWPGIVAEVPTLLVFSVPAIFSTRNARRAARVGDRRGWVPAGILLTITGYYLVTMMVAPLLG